MKCPRHALLAASLAITATSLLAGVVGAQSHQVLTLAPGDDRVRSATLQGYTAKWRQWVRQPDGTERAGINTIHDVVTVDRETADAPAIVRDLLWESTDGSTYRRVDVFDAKTMAPWRMSIDASGGAVEHVEFDGGRILALTLPGHGAAGSRMDAFVSTPVFNWSSDGFLLATLVLDGLDHFQLPAAVSLGADPDVRTMEFAVRGHETIHTLPFGSHETVIVEQVGVDNYRGTYWVSERPPYVVRVQFEQDNGTVTTWELF